MKKKNYWKFIMNSIKSINIISFDVPYPPNYGGAIDVFYKIKYLKELDIDIYLHLFEYGRGFQKHLEQYCKEVHYYKRHLNPIKLFNKKPFIVSSRENKQLISNISKNNFPILYEGLHTTFPLLQNSFAKRLNLVRTHNVEHFYYSGLAKSETNKLKSLYLKTEALKLKKYEPTLDKADFILTISNNEFFYYNRKFINKTKYIPAFHQNEKVLSKAGKGDYVLYHGDLNIPDNIKSVEFLIDSLSNTSLNFIIASNTIPKKISKIIDEISSIKYKKTSSEDIYSLIQNAHINVLVTQQKTGFKLKLINALFLGRFVIANGKMIENTGLENECFKAETKLEFKKKALTLINTEFTISDLENRKKNLEKFHPLSSAKLIKELI